MKRFAALAALAVLLLPLAACSAAGTQPAESVAMPVAATSLPASAPIPQPSPGEPAGEIKMSVSSAGIVDGIIDPKYGSHGSINKDGLPTLSIPLEISDAPKGTACFALFMADPDSEPLCGYTWVHWMAADFAETSLPEGLSADTAWKAAQGKNDFGKTGYGGPTPPDKDHKYVITVYALDAEINLTDGFTKEEFTSAVEGYVLAEAAIKGVYRK